MKAGGKVGIVGAGAWGIALAKVVMVRDVLVYSRRTPPSHRSLESHSTANSKTIAFTHDPEALKDCDVVIFASNAQYLRQFLQQVRLKSSAILVLAAKGIEVESGLLLSEVAKALEYDEQLLAILSGPNFANEVEAGQLSVTTIASISPDSLDTVTSLFAGSNLMVETTDDVLGIQICGAMKNAFAIGAGMLLGLGYGENTRAMFITQCLRELATAIDAVNAADRAQHQQRHTVFTSGAIGDLILTCYSLTSRNTKLGELWIRDHSAALAMLASQTVEGYYTVKALDILAQRMHLNLPICKVLYSILYRATEPQKLVHLLTSQNEERGCTYPLD